MMKGLETKPYEEQLRDLLGSLSSHLKRGLRGDMTAIFPQDKDCHMEDGTSLFSAVL